MCDCVPRSIRFLIFVLMIALLPAKALALSIDQMRIGLHPDKGRLVLDLSEPSQFRAFLLSDPYRIVIDLPDFEWRGGQVAKNSRAAITRVRHGALGQGYSRLVFDLKSPITIQSAFMLPADRSSSNRLVVDFTSSSDARFRQELTRMHGTLNMPGAPPIASATPPIAQEQNPFKTIITETTKTTITPSPVLDTPAPPPSGKKPVIVIDAGHGGQDPGARGTNGVNEKVVTLALAKELKKQLDATGQYKTFLTRDDDRFIVLKDRVGIARRHNADLFVSLHADSIERPTVRGASFYTLSDKASDEQSAKLAARENKADLIAGIDLSTEDAEVANILVDLTMRDTMNQSKFFSNKLKTSFSGASLSLLEKPQRSAGFAVLKAPDIPSVLVESGFMSNKNDAGQLNSPEHRKKLAGAISRAINGYFEQVRKNQRS